MRLASYGAHFIAQALARDPSLRPAAVRFAQAADSALKRDAPAPAAPATNGPQTPEEFGVPDSDATDRAA
jgi:hypothetical protein